MKPRRSQCLVQFRPICAFPAFHLDELADDLPVTAIEIARDRKTLRFQAETALALPSRANPVIRDELAERCHCLPRYVHQRMHARRDHPDVLLKYTARHLWRPSNRWNPRPTPAPVMMMQDSAIRFPRPVPWLAGWAVPPHVPLGSY